MAGLLPIARLRGRDGSTSPLALAQDMAVEATNIDWFESTLGRKRGGCEALTTGAVFSAVVSSALKHVPGNDQTLAEFWAFDDAATPNIERMAGGTSFATPTTTDALADAAAGRNVRGVSFNGKFFLAYDSAVDRLHVWDPNTGSGELVRVGHATPSAPSLADTGSGSYAASIIHVRIRYRTKTGSTVLRQSEASASANLTPSGSGAGVEVTKPASISESETHWIVEASDDNSQFYEVPSSETAVGTSTFTITTAQGDLSDGTASALTGAYVPPVSWKYLAVFNNRLIGANSWESGGRGSRVWFTQRLGVTNIADDERIEDTVDQENWIDLDESDGGAITGFAGPLSGNLIVFKERQIWKLIPTPVAARPFRAWNVTKELGNLRQECAVMGVDEDGDPAIYFADGARGFHRLGKRGIQFIGNDVKDLWATFSPGATNVPAHSLYYPDKHQVWNWVATGTNDPDECLVFDTQLGAFVQDAVGRKVFTGGWSRWNSGKIQTARCAVFFATTPGASMSLDQKPYIGNSDANDKIDRCDTGTDDRGTNFAAVVKTRPFALAEGLKVSTGEPILVAKESSAVTITVTADKDFGLETIAGTAVLTKAGSETRVIKRVSGLVTSDAVYHQYQLGDASAASNGWNLDMLLVQVGDAEGLP